MNPQQLQEARRVAGLIIGFIQRKLTPAQRQELDDWVGASDENMELFQQLTDEEKIEESIEWFKKLDEEYERQVLIGIKSRGSDKIADDSIPIGSLKKKNTLLWTAAAVAATIIIIAGVWWFGLVGNTKSDKLIAKNSDALNTIDTINRDSGESRDVILITGNGEKNILGKNNSIISLGDSVNALDSNQQLSYHHSVVVTNNTLIIPAGSTYRLQLADGSKVWLNAGSSLTYPTAFDGNERRVTLTGEAYYEIAKDKKKPFLVEAGNSTIRVTGTHFNIHAFTGENKNIVTLLEGGVEIHHMNKKRMLVPEQQATISKVGGIIIHNLDDAGESVAWTKGIFSFKMASIEEVMQEVSRWYGVTVQYNGSIKKEFTGTIPRTSSLENVLKILELSGNVHFAVQGKGIQVLP